jgi:hypothetical protein
MDELGQARRRVKELQTLLIEAKASVKKLVIQERLAACRRCPDCSQPIMPASSKAARCKKCSERVRDEKENRRQEKACEVARLWFLERKRRKEIGLMMGISPLTVTMVARYGLRILHRLKDPAYAHLDYRGDSTNA